MIFEVLFNLSGVFPNSPINSVCYSLVMYVVGGGEVVEYKIEVDLENLMRERKNSKIVIYWKLLMRFSRIECESTLIALTRVSDRVNE